MLLKNGLWKPDKIHFPSFLNQLAGMNSKVDDDDAKEILLSSMPSRFDHIVFTLNKMNPNLE